jgi:multiple sugar transport system ATP-binding protein
MTMADRIIILDEGELQQVGSPKEVYYRPNNFFVADFIGSPSMNFFDVDVTERPDGTVVIYDDGFEYPIYEHDISDLVGRTNSFQLGIRPENIEIVENETNLPERYLEGTVDVVETVGSDNFLYILVGDKECRVRESFDVEPAEGETVYFTFDESDIHLFDAETGDAVFHGGEAPTPQLADENIVPSES